LHKYFFGIFEKYEEFSLVMDKCTNNHECLVLDNTQVNNKIEECIFYYKADHKIGKFRLGKSIFFKLDHYFRRSNDKNTMGKHGEPPKTKLPDPIQPKKRIQQVEKDDEEDQDQHGGGDSGGHGIHIHNHIRSPTVGTTRIHGNHSHGYSSKMKTQFNLRNRIQKNH
jgi:hypothetical protein